MATRYVSLTGVDAPANGTFVSPYATINYGLQQTFPGDTLYIRGGTYTENIQDWGAFGPINSGTSWADAPLVSAYLNETVTLNGMIDLRGVSWFIIQNLTLTGGTNNIRYGDQGAHHLRFINLVGTNASTHAIIQSASSGGFCQLLGGDFHDFGIGAGVDLKTCYGYLMQGSDNLVDGTTFFNGRSNGIYSHNDVAPIPARNVIRNCTFINLGTEQTTAGAIVIDGGTGHQVYNNLVINSLCNGIMTGGGDAGTGIWFNTVYGHSQHGLYLGSFGAPSTNGDVRNNLLWLNNAGNLVNFSQTEVLSNNWGATTGFADPLFVNPSIRDFHLQPTSPCIDAGIPVALGPTTDKDGNSRTVGAAPDIGAYEVQAGVTIRTYQPTGGVALAGAAPRQTLQIASTSGGLAFTGTTTPLRLHVFPVSGGLLYAGAAATGLNGARSYQPTGGLALAGSAPHASVRMSLAPTGGVLFAGSALTTPHIRAYVPTGGLHLAGAAIVTRGIIYPYTASGILILSGAATTVKGQPGGRRARLGRRGRGVVVATRTLTVTRLGTGFGTVVSAPGAIMCGTICTGTFPNGTVLQLTPTALSGSQFALWGGTLVGGTINNQGQLSIIMDQDRALTATFNLVQATQRLTVSTTGGGLGTISTTPPGILVGPTNQSAFFDFPTGSLVTLTATPQAGQRFDGFAGACSGLTCSVFMDTAHTVSGGFSVLTPVVWTLSITHGGTGAGHVTSQPAGIDCA